MKFTILTENTACSEELGYEHGLSIYIEANGKRILFDAGQTELFSENAERLGIDLTTVELAVLSHDHYDHSGGMGKFLEINSAAPLYVNRNALAPHYNALGEYIGIDMSVFGTERVILTDDEYRISDGISLFTCNTRERKYPIDPSGLKMLCDGKLTDEDFCHEQYMLIEEDGKRILISGCSHKGILDIMNWVKPDMLIGGFHFMNITLDNEDNIRRLENAATELISYDCIYYTGHCTGIEQFDLMKKIMGDKLLYISAGRTFEF